MPYKASCTVCGTRLIAEEAIELAEKLKEHYGAQIRGNDYGRCDLFFVKRSEQDANGVVKELVPITLEVVRGVLVRNPITEKVFPIAVSKGKERG